MEAHFDAASINSSTLSMIISVTIRNQPSYAGKKISRVIREIFCSTLSMSIS